MTEVMLTFPHFQLHATKVKHVALTLSGLQHPALAEPTYVMDFLIVVMALMKEIAQVCSYMTLREIAHFQVSIDIHMLIQCSSVDLAIIHFLLTATFFGDKNLYTHSLTDYCAEAGIEGFNCLPEQLCVPQEHRCDGVPDCGFIVFATDEIIGCSGMCIYHADSKHMHHHCLMFGIAMIGYCGN